MTRTEARFAAHLELARQAGEIQGWLYEPMRLVLGPRCTYCPDFLVVEADGSIALYEVKGTGGWLDAKSKVKVRAAAERYPFIRFVGAVEKKGGGWACETFVPAAPWPPPVAPLQRCQDEGEGYPEGLLPDGA